MVEPPPGLPSGDPPADLADRLRKVRAPTLVIAGARDMTAGVARVVAVADLFPQRSCRRERAFLARLD
jgi:pimeloyl-ACP methyl ester carboxylesterase